MFTTDSHYDPRGKPFREFSARLAKAGKRKTPTVNTLLGYDVCRMLMGVIASGATRRTEIAVALPTVRKFEGVHSTISFGPGRVNSFLSILQFQNRTIRKVGEIDLTASDSSGTRR
jgi:hypothetical protein